MLPWSCTVTTTFSIGRPSFSAADWMMRRFAWCGTSQSISLRSTPFFASVSSTSFESVRTATLKTSLPCIFRPAVELLRSVSKPFDTPYGKYSRSWYLPSE